MNVFLTGGAGSISQALFARILMRGCSLKVLVRDLEVISA
jgi:NAD dependent epimerase/dehydratase family enzyme